MSDQKQALLEQYLESLVRVRRVLFEADNVSIEERVATMLQVQALDYIHKNPETTVGELAKNLSMSSSAIAQLTDRLASMEWITKVKDTNDHRIVHLVLTPNGHKEMINMRRKKLEQMAKLLEHVSEKDLTDLVRINNKILRKLELKSL